jgi:hypothetical protein
MPLYLKKTLPLPSNGATPFVGQKTLKNCVVCERLESLEKSYNPILKTGSNIHEALLRCRFQAKVKFKFPPPLTPVKRSLAKLRNKD